MNDRMRHSGRWRCLLAEQDVATMSLQYARGRESKFLGQESSVVGDDQRGGFLLRSDVARNRRSGTAHAGKIEIVGDNAAPAGGAEMDGLGRHERLLYLGRRAVDAQESHAGESQE